MGDKAVGGMDDDKDHTGNVIGGLKSYADPRVSLALGLSLHIPSSPDLTMPANLQHHSAISNPSTSAKAKEEAERKVKVLEGK